LHRSHPAVTSMSTPEPTHTSPATCYFTMHTTQRGRDRRRGMGGLHLGSALLIVPDVVLEKPHHRRSQGTSSFPEELSTGIKPVDPG
ncbi:hypothetical protein ACWEQN_44600, partial [Streptomyces sp. NPDC004129]